MIRFRTVPDVRWPLIFDSFGAEMPEDFLLSPHGSAASGIIIAEGKQIAAATVTEEGDSVMIRLMHDPSLSVREKRRLVYWISERSIKMKHPAKVLMDTDIAPAVMNGCGFYAKGRIMQKIIEKWRYMVPDAVFDPEGYIVDQGKMEALPFGWFDTRAKGCGWIAAYNLLRMMGHEIPMQNCAEELQKHAFLGDVMGQDLPRLVLWLRRKGLPVHLSRPSNAVCARLIPETCGILLYTHARGGHYVTYRGIHNGKAVFYNGVYGRCEHTEEAAAYLKNRVLFPFATVIYVKEEL